MVDFFGLDNSIQGTCHGLLAAGKTILLTSFYASHQSISFRKPVASCISFYNPFYQFKLTVSFTGNMSYLISC